MSNPLLVALSILLLGMPSPAEATSTKAGENSARCPPTTSSGQVGELPPACRSDDLGSKNQANSKLRQVGAGLHYVSTSKGPNQTSWTMGISRDPDRVSLDGPAEDGVASLSGGCNRLLGPGLWATLYQYNGKSLKRIDDESENVVFTIVSSRDGEQAFPGQMHYVESDKAWVTTTALPTDFIIALSQGDTLKLANARADSIVSFKLKGIAPIVKTMREICGF